MFGFKKIFNLKKFWPKKNFWSEKNSWFEKIFGPKTNFWFENKFLVRNKFLVQEFFQQTKNLSKKKLGSEKIKKIIPEEKFFLHNFLSTPQRNLNSKVC